MKWKQVAGVEGGEMTTLADQLKKALAFDFGVHAEVFEGLKWPDGHIDAGVEGAERENARLAPIHEALIDAIRTLEGGCLKAMSKALSLSTDNKDIKAHLNVALDRSNEALAKLTQALEGK